MDKKIIKTNDAPAPIGAYNQAVLTNDTLYISGQIALDPKSGALMDDDLQTETEQVMKSLQAILKEAGFTFEHVVKCTLLLQDINDFQIANNVYSDYFDEETAPAREAFQVEDLPKGANIEISAIAVQ